MTEKTQLVYAENTASVKPLGNDVMWRKGLLSGKEFQELVAMNKCNNAHFANVLRGGGRDRFRSQRNPRSFRLLNFNHVPHV